MSELPRHAKAAGFARAGLFRDAQSFQELERRIEALGTELERGGILASGIFAALIADPKPSRLSSL
jgi:hypothetical protein